MITWLNSPLQPLPKASSADPEGLVAVGGDLSPIRLEEAYSKGIFPWYAEDVPIMWWSPDPRMVLFPEELHVPKSLRPALNQNRFDFKIDGDFLEVIRRCSEAPRPGQEGTWILEEVIEAYGKWHKLGRVHSFESWKDGKLVGGLYGVSLGGVFFGESMYTIVPDASKYAFVKAVQWLQTQGVDIIDCQMSTAHLSRFGAREIDREVFLAHLKESLPRAQPNWPESK